MNEPLTPESVALIETLERREGEAYAAAVHEVSDGISEARLIMLRALPAIERAAAERAREGHIREFLESESFKDDLMRALHQNAPLGHPPTQFVRSICSFAGSHRADADEIAEWLLARHPEAAS